MLIRSLLSAIVIASALALPVHEAAAQGELLRLGFLTIRAGPLAAGGRQMEEGINLFLKALHSVRLTQGPMGPIRLDEYGKPVLNMYIRKVERKDGQLVSTVVETVKEVSQFRTYDPKQFLAAPQYARDIPPAKNLE